MAEEVHILLTRVGPTFPAGTVVGLYPGLVPDAGVPRPVGEPIATATVSAEESLDFGTIAVTQRTYWAAAQVEELWRSIQVTVKAGETPSVIAMGERGTKGDKGDTGGAILGEEQVETKHLKAGAVVNSKIGVKAVGAENLNDEAVSTAKIAASAVTEVKLAAAASAKLVTADSINLITASGLLGAAAAAGTYEFINHAVKAAPAMSAERLNAPFVFLHAGIKYKAHAVVLNGTVAPKVAFSIAVARVKAVPAGAISFEAAQTLFTTAKQEGPELAVEKEGEFEVGASGLYLLQVITTEATAASSSTGLVVGINR